MPRERLTKLAIYSLLPLLLAILAISLNSLFQPQFQWKLKLLEIPGESYRIEGLGANTTVGFDQPRLDAFSKDEETCITTTDVIYTRNQLMQDRSTIQKWVDADFDTAFALLLLAVLHAVGNSIYLLIKQRTDWAIVGVIGVLAVIAVIALVTLLDPLTSLPQVACLLHLKAQAELTSISLDGLVYPILGTGLNMAALVVMVKRYTLQSEIFTD